MIKLKEYLPAINMIVIIGACIFIFFNCGLSRSPLIEDPKYPLACKQILEGDYFKQNNKGGQGSVLAMIGEACKGQLAINFCFDMLDARFKNSSKETQSNRYQLCLAKQGK